MPGKGSGVPVGAPPTVRTAIEPNLRASPHSHPTRVLLQSISGVGVQYPGKGSGFTCRSTAPRCEPESNRTSEPAPFAPDTGAPTINIRRWGSMPGKGSGFTCRSTAHGANRNRAKTQSQPPIRTRHGCSYGGYGVVRFV